MSQKTVVVGAGPVGALAAIYAARRGDKVEVYELRNDLRDPSSTPLNFTKSINLALSERAFNSVRHANCPGLLEKIQHDTIPMYGRMIHGIKNDKLFENAQAYDVYGRAIRAADRFRMNQTMLDELERMPNVTLFFNHKLTGADFKKNLAWFERREPWTGAEQSTEVQIKRPAEIEVSFDFMIGADGAHSAARFHLMKFARMSYQQEYIDTIWCEFTMSPAPKDDPGGRPDGFRLSPNHLHIWPAGSFMFIAIANQDKSFTCTLFMPAAQFDAIDANEQNLVSFFNTHFPGIVPNLISESEVKEQYESNPHLPLISIKCSPYHFMASAVVVGDAAHAMVPFYGQGLNAGFEDVRVLYEIFDKHLPPNNSNETSQSRESLRAAALKEYTDFRKPDSHIINDLAMGNYREMRSDVLSRIYLLRKKIEELLSVKLPSIGFATQYSRISFSNERYSDVEKSVHRQHTILNAAGATLALLATSVGLASWWRRYYS